MSYLSAVPRYRTHYSQKIMWKPNKKKMPPRCSSQSVSSMPRRARREFSRERRQTECAPKNIPMLLGGATPPLPFGYSAFETTSVPFMPVPTAVRGLEDMLSAVPTGPAHQDPHPSIATATVAASIVIRPITREVYYTLSRSFIDIGDNVHTCLGGGGGGGGG